MCQELQDTIVDLQARILIGEDIDFRLQNAEAQFVIRRVQVHDKAALKTRFDPFFEILDFARGTISRDDDLLVLIHQGVESMKELFLGAVLAGDELHIVDHQDVNGPEHLLEVHHTAVPQGLYEPVHELFCRQVDDIQSRTAGLQLPCDCVHQVRFAKPDTAIQKKRVERHWPAFGDTLGRGMGQFVRLTHHEAVEGKTIIQGRRCQDSVGGLLRSGRGGGGSRLRRRFDRGIRGNLKIDAANGRGQTGHFVEDQVTKVLRYIVTEKTGGNREGRRVIRYPAEFEWFYPVRVVVFANSFQKVLFDLAPLILRHASPFRHWLCPPYRPPYSTAAQTI